MTLDQVMDRLKQTALEDKRIENESDSNDNYEPEQYWFCMGRRLGIEYTLMLLDELNKSCGGGVK